MDKKQKLFDLGFTKENENTYFYSLSKERKIIIDINVVGALNDSVYVNQYDDVVFLFDFNDKQKIANLIDLLS